MSTSSRKKILTEKKKKIEKKKKRMRRMSLFLLHFYPIDNSLMMFILGVFRSLF